MRAVHGLLVVAGASLALACPNPDKLIRPVNTGGAGQPGADAAGGSRDGSPTSDAAAGGTGGGAGGSGGATGGAGGATGGAGGTGGAGTGGTAGASVPRNQLCAQYADAWAQMVLRCSPTLVNASFGTTANHRARLIVECGLLDLPGVKWPPQPIAACVTALQTFPCQEWIDGGVPPACLAPGAFANGATCSTGAQCQSRNCGQTGATGCGKCEPTPQLGQACEGFCDVGLACNLNGQCVRPGTAGAACDDTATLCRRSLVCLGGSCQPRQTAGGFCTSVEECNLHAGAICNTNQMVCVNVSFGPMCKVNPDGSLVACAGSGYCNPGDGSCTPASAEGGACNDDTGPFCVPPAACTNGACELPNLDPGCNSAAPVRRQAPAVRRDPGGALGAALFSP